MSAHLLLLPVLFLPVAGVWEKLCVPGNPNSTRAYFTASVIQHSQSLWVNLTFGQFRGHSDDHDSPGSASLGLPIRWRRQTQLRTVMAQSLQGCGRMLKDQPAGVRQSSPKEGLLQLRLTRGEKLQGGEGLGGEGGC